ncbi:MAG: ParB/RepB/Spo0J family partition protein [Firmicutes bacterium]|nr:ParB/RepB/Spo0J family partition protein [Bacillota bacterium]
MQVRLGDVLRARVKDLGKRQQVPTSQEADIVRQIPLADIEVNPFQPRETFNQEAIQELAQSLEEHGLIQPIVVRSCPEGYQLVAGERRVRAAAYLGWETISAVVRELDDAASAQMALIENLQREDLDFWEEALAYQQLLEQFGMTQDELAQSIGKSQSSIANKLRLLKLSPKVRSKISREIMTERHCRALLRLDSETKQLEVIETVKAKQLSVRETEALIGKMLNDDVGGDTSQKSEQKITKVWRDARLLQNSVRELVKEMRSGGVEVELEESVTSDLLEMQITIQRQQVEK